MILISTVGLFVFAVALYGNHLPEGNAKYAFAVASSWLGFWTSVTALILSLVGKGPACAPVALASVGLAALWVIGIVTY